VSSVTGKRRSFRTYRGGREGREGGREGWLRRVERRRGADRGAGQAKRGRGRDVEAKPIQGRGGARDLVTCIGWEWEGSSSNRVVGRQAYLDHFGAHRPRGPDHAHLLRGMGRGGAGHAGGLCGMGGMGGGGSREQGQKIRGGGARARGGVIEACSHVMPPAHLRRAQHHREDDIHKQHVHAPLRVPCV